MAADPLKQLIAELGRFPGIGPKTATRLAHHVMRSPLEEVRALGEALLAVKEQLTHCSACNSITPRDPCRICDDPQRDRSRICVVEEPFNIDAMERSGEFRGLYHALMGVLSPQRGIGPEQLAIDGLLQRMEGIEEVIVATNPNVEGEATALYLARRLAPYSVRVSRLAMGLPVGGDIEYMDDVTLARALSGRYELR